MKNFLSKLWSLSRTDRVRTLAIDAVSLPSFCRVNMLKLVSVMAILLTVGVGQMWADCTKEAERTFAKSDWTQSISSYTSTWSDLNCDFYRVSNNSKNFAYARMAVKGGSNTSSTTTATGYIRYKTAINSAVSKVMVIHAGTTDAIGTNLAINWVAISVYNGSTKVDSVTITSSSLSFYKDKVDTIVFTPTSGDTWSSGYKYNFYANIYCKGSSNRGLNITKLEFDNCSAGCSNTVALSKGSESHGAVTTISSANVATCSGTASDRRVTITVTPDECYDAPSTLTWTKSSGTVSASKQSGPTDNGDGTYSYVYQFAQNDNGAGTFGVTCTAKAAGKTVNFNAGPGSCGTSSLTETCDGSGVTLPAVTASGVCKGWTTFAGWATAAVSDSTTTSGVTLYAAGDNFVPASNGQTLYAVYSKSKGGSGFKLSLVVSSTTYYVGKQNGSNNYLSAETNSANAAIFTYENGYLYYDDSGTKKYISITGNNTSLYVTTDKPEVTWTESGTTTFSYLTSAATRYLAYNGSASPVRFASYNNNSSYPQYFTKTSTATTYYCSDPNCCTPLGSLNGSVSFTNPTEAEVTWDIVDNVSRWTLKYKVHGAGDWTTAFSNKTASDTEITEYDSDSDSEDDRNKASISGLDCNTAYDFQIIANPASGYCDKDETLDNSGSGYNSGKWSVTYDLTNVSKTSGPNAGANVCGDFEAIFAAASGSALPDKAAITVTGASDFTWTKGTGTLTINEEDITDDISITMAGACTAFSLHTGNHSSGGWVTNNCFGDADWGSSDDAIWEGEFPSTNACYVGWQGSTSSYGKEWAIGGIKTYDIPTGRTLGWNGSDYYNDYPATALGTFHIYKNSTSENYYLRFKPEAYVLRTGTDGTGWTSTAMTKSASNSHYYETDFITLTEDLINEHAYVDLKANNVNGHVWCNFSSDDVAEGNVKVKASPGDESSNFRATDLADGDVGMYGKFRIDVTKDVDNWKLAFVPFYHVTYNGSGASGSTAASAYVEKGSTVSAAANGFIVPTGKTFAGWATSSSRASAGTVDYAAGASVTVNADTELFAVWSWINYTVTVNQSPAAGATLSGGTTTAHYGGTINISTDEPDGYAFDKWTSSDGITFADASSTSTSFTMPNKDVTVQANFKKIHTVTWHVNGSSYSTGVVDGNTYVVDGNKISDVPTAPANNTLNNCANKFMGWSTTNITKGSPVTDDDDIEALALFTDKAGSPTISANTDFYAVFAEGEDGTAQLTTAEITAAYCSGSGSCGSVTSYANGPYDISSDDGNWEGAVCAINNGSIGMRATDASQSLGRPRLISPDYGGSVTKITITATNGSLDDRYIYICSSATASPATENIGSGTANKNATTSVEIEPSSAVSSFYIYVNNALTFTSIEVEYSSGENYVTQCADNQVRVTYDFNDGTGTACTEGVTTKSASYTVCSTEPEKDYYDFAGWNDGTSTYDAGDTYNLLATTTFTAQWTATSYDITYVLDGGTNDGDNPATYTVETSDITLKAATKGHSRFDGWFTDNGVWSEEVTTISNGSHGNITLYAKWTDRNEIKFYADASLLATIYRASDENLQASIDGQGSKPSDPSAPSACSSKVFKGWTETWFNDETDTEPADLNDATGTRSADKTYYAVWATQSGSLGSYTYSAYSTTCCANEVTVSGGSPTNGKVTFDKSYAWTCKGDREIVMTIAPAAGYQLHTFSVATGDGKVAAKSMSADVALDNNSSAAQVITLTFAKDADGAYDVTATFTEMTVTSWTWTYNSGDIPDPIDVYVGQKKQIDVVMSPSGVLPSHKNNLSYTYDVNSTYIGNPNRASAYFTFEGKAATESTTITLTHNDDTSSPKAFPQTVNVRVKPLPLVHFVDNVHNESFDDVVATVSGDKLSVSMEKTTPTHVDFTGSTANSCEETHLHLIGWIRGDWPAYVAYMNGTGSAPSNSDLTGATGYFYAPGAEITLTDAMHGMTFYAVWAKVE